MYCVSESDWRDCSSPGLWVISEDIEEGVNAGFELPGSKNVGEMGNVAFPPVRERETLLDRNNYMIQ